MHKLARGLAVVAVLALAAGCGRLSITDGLGQAPGGTTAGSGGAPAEPEYWPTTGWRSSTPEAQGMDSALLAEMVEQIQAQAIKVRSVLVVRHGMVVAEANFDPFEAETRQPIASVTKSVIGMLVGIAVDQGLLSGADQTLGELFPDELAGADAEKRGITLGQLLSMTSGLDCSDLPREGKPVMEASPDWVAYMLGLPMASRPGSSFNYCSGPIHLLSAVIGRVTGMSAREFANRELFAPLGIAEVPLETWGSDPQGVTLGGYDLALTAQELGKLGLLMLQQGRWEGKQLVPADWVAESTRQHTTKEDGTGYGYAWTVYPDEGRYAALGRGGQHIHVAPGRDLVVVFTGALNSFAEAPEVNALLHDYILPAVKAEKALEANAAGAARLEAAQRAAAEPERAMRDLPEVAREVSEHTYFFDENPLGWQMLWLSFSEAEARVTLNGTQRYVIGLDNCYRLTEENGGSLALRANWADARTLVVDQIAIGDAGQIQSRWTFEGETVDIVVNDAVSGGVIAELHGER